MRQQIANRDLPAGRRGLAVLTDHPLKLLNAGMYFDTGSVRKDFLFL